MQTTPRGRLGSVLGLTLTLFATTGGCGLVKVNGKPLGGGSSPPPATSYADPDSRANPNASASGGQSGGNAGQSGGNTASAGPAGGTKKLRDIKAPDKTAPLTSWTPIQQWQPDSSDGYEYGYSNLSGRLVVADELGDHLSQLGRATLIVHCFRNVKADATGALAWMLCGADVTALDVQKLVAELVAEGIEPGSRNEVVGQVKEQLEAAKKIGAAVEAAAKDDPGVASLLGLRESARAEWTAYASKNREAIDRYLALKDAVRSGKSNNKGFDGCYEATKAPFTKLVRSTKFPWDTPREAMIGYVAPLLATTHGYITTVAYAACAVGQDKAAESIYAAAANQMGGGARAGARSIALAKALDPAFKPKFADRSLSLNDMAFQWKYGIEMPGVLARASIMNPADGTIAALKRDGETVKVLFRGDTVDACLQWRDTNKVSHVSSSGSVSYERACVKRGSVANQESPVEVPAKYIDGLAPGVNVIVIPATQGFPVCAWKGKAFTAILGISTK